MSKGGDQQVTTQRELDPQTQRFLDEFRSRGLARADAAGTPPAGFEGLRGVSQGLLQNFDFANQQGLTGVDQFINPETDNLLGGVGRDFDRRRLMQRNQIGAAATGQNAFGGNRAELAGLQSDFDLSGQEFDVRTGIRKNAFDSGVARLLSERQRAGQLGQQGFQNLFGLGQFMDARQRAALAQLIPGFQTGGSTTTETSPQEGGGVFGGLLGLGGTLLGGPLGGIAGNAIGGLFGGGGDDPRITQGGARNA